MLQSMGSQRVGHDEVTELYRPVSVKDKKEKCFPYNYRSL